MNDKPYRSKQTKSNALLTGDTPRVNKHNCLSCSPASQGYVMHSINQTFNLKTKGNYMRNLMIEEMTRPPIDPEAQKLALNLILTEKVAPDYEKLLENLLIAIAKDREAIRIMATKQAMAEAVAAMKHLWD